MALLREFYWMCNADQDRREEYYDLIDAMIVTHEDPSKPLDPTAKTALQNGDAFTVRSCAVGSGGTTLLDFFTKVKGNRDLTAKMEDLHRRLLLTYGGSLTPEQIALVRLGDAKLISQALVNENGGTPLPFPVVVWTTACTVP